MIKRLLPLALAGLLYLTPQSANAKDRVYCLLGTSSNSENPLHVYAGINTSKNLGKKVSLGLDVNVLLEHKNYETSVSAKLDKEIGDYSIGTAWGVSLVRLSKPLESSSKQANENFVDGSSFVRFNLTKNLDDKLRLKAVFQINNALPEMFENNYPRYRVALGLETLF